MEKKKLGIQWFIEQHSDWEKMLQEKPYCLQISRDVWNGRNLIMFKYNQIDSDFNVGLVRECRGLILDEDTLEPVCVPFFKFGNYGESYCPEIDWKNCWVSQKIDGSLAKVVRYGNNLLISTNGTIDAFKAPLAEQIGCEAKSFGDLIVEGIKKAMNDYYHRPGAGFYNMFDGPLDWFKGLLDEGKTYMFEITSPWNKVVVTWHEVKLWFLGCRDNSTFKESYFTDDKLNQYFDTPKVFPLRSIDECVKAAQELDVNEEGYVVCDSNFNRVKVKSPTYVSLHHMKNNNCLSFERGIEIVRGNELAEVLTYFPEFSEHLNKIKEDFDGTIMRIEKAWNSFLEKKSSLETRKDQAIFITKKENFGSLSGIGFALLDGKIGSVREWFEKQPTNKVAKALGYKEEKNQ